MKLKRPSIKLPFDFADILVFLGVGLVTYAFYEVQHWLAALFLGAVFIFIGILKAR